MRWEEVPEVMDSWALKSAETALDVRRAASRVLASTDIGYYYHPELEKVAIHAPRASEGDAARAKAAAERAVGTSNVAPFLTDQLRDPEGRWVKVAYSPTLRRTGEALNFFPGQYPGGVPNHPSPLASMLTSGLLGAGLGWGAGTLLGKFLPEGYGQNLGRTGLLLGAGAGVLPGAAWGLTNKLTGKRLNDPSLLGGRPGDEPVDYPVFSNGSNAVPPAHTEGWHAPGHMGEYLEEMAHHAPHLKHALDALAAVKLGSLFAQAAEKTAAAYGDAFGEVPASYGPTPLDVNINALGQTLYSQGASPNLAATTMSAMYAAQQLPDPRSSPGWATYGQLGQLAQNSAGDYARGVLTGAALNLAIGTPYRASSFGLANVGLGIIGAVVPKLFGG